MKLHLVDGTFELFRHHFGSPPATAPDGQAVGAVRGLARSLLALASRPDVSHIGVAFDHVIESFRNDLFAGYKTGEGIEPELFAQFHLAEDVCRALGFTTWSMVAFEADDALATAAFRFRDHVDQVVLCSPDKDLAQCVVGDRVVCWDRIRDTVLDEAGVIEKFGVPPALIPDFLALVGDTADGIPGVPRWGQKSASAVLAHFGGLANIPRDVSRWDVKVRGAAGLVENLVAVGEQVDLYRTLAVLRTDVPLAEDLEALAWKGASRAALDAVVARTGDDRLLARVPRFRD